MNQPEIITVVTAHTECCMCPTIISGKTSDGWTIYVRYRWGLLSVRIYPENPAPFGGAEGVWILSKQIDPDGLDGCMSYDVLKEHTAEIVNWPAEITPRSFDETDTWLDL